MVFNSLTFMVFFAVVLLVSRLPLPWKLRKLWLLTASYAFYAAWNPPFVALLFISRTVDWYSARAMAQYRSTAARRLALGASLCTNLGLLGFFKYSGFLLSSFSAGLATLGLNYQPPDMGIVLPVGISLYTFQTLSYTIDVYRGRINPCDSALDFGLYVSFFPQLVAGPIVRAKDSLPQCISPRKASARQLGWGLTLLLIGLFEKTVLADSIFAPVSDRVYGSPLQAGCLDTWIGTLAFSGQIFFDFAGYSTCAVGAAMCLGFMIPDNFRCPYAALGFSDFWQRWHVSLSTWLRDYLYIPLGGSHRGRTRTCINLFVTMLLGGLWHGASWHFVAWGGLHACFLAIEHLLRRLLWDATWASLWPARAAATLLTFALVCLAWVFFRAGDLLTGIKMLCTMLGGGSGNLVSPVSAFMVTTCCMGVLTAQWLMRNRDLESVWDKVPWWGRSAALCLLTLAVALSPGEDRAFIYFQF